MAWRTPNPADLAAFLPYVVARRVLSDSDAARLNDRMLFQRSQSVTTQRLLGLLGDPPDARDPTPF